MPLSKYELEREKNILKNKDLFQSLDLQVASDAVPTKPSGQNKPQPVKSSRAKKRSVSDIINAPRRQSVRLLRQEVSDPDESPSKRRKREKDMEEFRQTQEKAKFEEEERNRITKLPRHHDLDIQSMGEGENTTTLLAMLGGLTRLTHGEQKKEPFVDDAEEVNVPLDRLIDQFSKLRVVSRAKVTQNRIYSAVYHGEKTKDLIFFGDKHGQLGIWDARASPDEVNDEDDGKDTGNAEGGKIWQLQHHWPETSKSSISCCKLDPRDAHSIWTTSYDTTVRKFNFETGNSQEIHTFGKPLPTSMDFSNNGNEVWFSDAGGMVSHLDIRSAKRETKQWQLSNNKIGCISVNPSSEHSLLCSSNDRTLRIWDSRKLQDVPLEESDDGFHVAESDVIEEFITSDKGKGTKRSEWRHGMSVSSAYWSPSGSQIVSTSYDDTLRLWKTKQAELTKLGELHSFRPFKSINHNCQTGKWLTILKAQWCPNPDVYPHFTIGNMKHSLDVFSGKGDLIARLQDPEKITAVQAVTCTSPTVPARLASGNGSGRCVLWGTD